MPAADRYVPGAPPPAPSSKSQKKKRKGAAAESANDSDAPSVVIPDTQTAALVEKAPEPEDIQSGAVAPELVVDTPIEEVKLSPIVDLIAKRLKALNKKIKRANTYSSVDPLTLDEDQKALLKNLSSLEAVQKELGEVRKAVESHEAELGGLLAAEKSRVAKAQEAQVSEAIAAARATSKKRTLDALNLVRLFNYLSQGDPTATSLQLNDQELNAISAAARGLLSHHAEAQQTVIDALYMENGEYEGVPSTRILEIIAAFENPATGAALKANGDHAPGTATPHEAAPRASGTGSFSFMQADELEAAPEQPETKVEPEPEPSANDSPAEEAEPAEEAPAPNQDNISWADDEGGLPSLSGLQEKFGASGSATPADAGASTPALSVTEATPDDGFTQARGRGPRGGGRGGHRGRGGDGYRGDRSRRGSFRGRGDGGERGPRRHDGERGSYRGRGGDGGERGRGSGRGGERGPRGRGDRNRVASQATA